MEGEIVYRGRLTVAPSLHALEEGQFITRSMDLETARELYKGFRDAGVACILVQYKVEEEHARFSSQDVGKSWRLA